MLELNEFKEFMEKSSRLYLPKQYRYATVKAIPYHTEDGQVRHRLMLRDYDNKGSEMAVCVIEPVYARYKAGKDLLSVVRDEIRCKFRKKKKRK